MPPPMVYSAVFKAGVSDHALRHIAKFAGKMCDFARRVEVE